jgi:endonuclease-3 related protein
MSAPRRRRPVTATVSVMPRRPDILELYELLHTAYGPQHWWPAETAFEVMVGAMLTQNTAWANVEKALAKIRAADALDPHRLHALPQSRLEELCRPAGFFRVKSRRLRNLMNWLHDGYGGDLGRVLARDAARPARSRAERLREELLEVNGVGRETADSIVLYAFDLPTFVVDTYTYRVLLRHRIIDEGADYETMRELFHEKLPPDTALYKQFHALFVCAGKDYCKPTPRCEGCPLDCLPHDGRKL